MANIFPIGLGQQLVSRDGLLFEINESAHDYTTDLGLIGYSRTIKKDYLKSVVHQINGTPNVQGVRHQRYFTFEWALQISPARYDILSAMWYEQTDRINTYATDVGIKLYDARQVLLVRSNPRQRAKLLNVPLPIDTPTPPVGYEYIYPLCNILITDLNIEPYILPNGLFRVNIKADELSIFNASQDE